jgi:hypothetical protein
MKAELTNLGYDVYSIPELPTLLMSNGAMYPGNDPNKYQELLDFETEVFKFQLNSEETFRKLASISGKPSVVICDRGVMDIAAYMSDDLFNEVCGKLTQSRQSLFNRYDIVCHLVTTADGAEEYYTKSNNIARSETAEQARELDKKTRLCWFDHERFHLIPNGEGGYQEKLELATKYVVDYVKSIEV